MNKLIISKPMVTKSAAGYYVGQWCYSFCYEPWDRETGYYATFEQADKVLRELHGDDVTTMEEFSKLIDPIAKADHEAYQAGRKQDLEIRCVDCKTLYHLHVNETDYDNYMQGKEFIQVAFKYLDADEREMISSKTCPVCFNKQFGEE